jgi:hypothetical protein
MRTTLTLDEDVATALEQLRRKHGGRLKTVVNDLLREGLRHAQERPTRRSQFRTQSVDLGRLRASSVDNVADALATAEDEAFK